MLFRSVCVEFARRHSVTFYRTSSCRRRAYKIFFERKKHLAQEFERRCRRRAARIKRRREFHHITSDNIATVDNAQRRLHEIDKSHAARLRCSRSWKRRGIEHVQINGEVDGTLLDRFDCAGETFKGERTQIRMSLTRPFPLRTLPTADAELMNSSVYYEIGRASCRERV